MRILMFLFFVALISCNQSNQETASSGEMPNIVLIMADDVMPEHFSCYGGDIPTPNIDKLASQGMRFEKAYCVSSACTPSRYAIMTGQYPGRCSHDEFRSENDENKPYSIQWNTPVSKEKVTLHEVLNHADYYTGYVGKFHIGPLHFDDPESNDEIPAIDPNMDLDSEMADSILGIYQSVISSKVRDITGADYAASIQWENPEQIPVKQLRHHNLEWQTQGVADFFANRENEKPFFLHLNSTALHGPSLDLTLEQDPKYTPGGRIDNPYKYHPPRETIYDRLDSMGIDMSESVPDYIRHYNAGIPYLDDQVGAVIQILRENNALENTLIILTADHGIEPGKSVNYNIGVRVPFIAKWDKQIKPESVSDQIVQFTDFMPTFAELASVDIEENHIVDGMSFVPALYDQPMPDRKAYFEMGYLRGIMDDYYKYISLRYPQQDLELIQKGTDRMVSHFGIGEGQQAFAVIAMEYHPGYFDADQLYDMKNDYYEQNNLAKINEYSDTLQLYKNELKKVLESFTHPYPIDNNEFTHWDKYWELANEARKVGTSTIYWWERDLDYPPQDNERMYKLQ